MTPWIFMAAALAAAASLIVYRRLRKDRAAALMEAASRQDRSARITLSEQDSRERREGVLRLLNEERYEEALEAIERLLPVLPVAERGQFANYVAYAFEGLAESQEPRRVLKLYDDERSKGAAVAFAEAHGKGDQIAHALAESLRYFQAPRNREGLGQFLTFIERDSPLLNRARSLFPQEFAEQLDYRAAESLNDWRYGGSVEGLKSTQARVRERLGMA